MTEKIKNQELRKGAVPFPVFPVRALLLSLLSILLAFSALVGTSYAWFTGALVIDGNTIETGTWQLLAYECDANGEVLGEKLSINEFGSAGDVIVTPLIEEEGWEPGRSVTKYIAFYNGGQVDMEIQFSFHVANVGEGTLQDVLWYSLENYTAMTDVQRATVNRYSMKALENSSHMVTFSLPAGQLVIYRLGYGMYLEGAAALQNLDIEED